MSLTARGVPYPGVADANNTPANFLALAGWVNDAPGVAALTTTARNALTGAALWDGRMVLNTTTDRLNRYDLGTTTWVEIPDTADIAALLATSGTPAALGTTASRGVSTSAARADHVHAWPAWAAITPTISGVTVSSAFGRWVQLGKTTIFQWRFTINAAPSGTIGVTLPATAATPTGFTTFGSDRNIGTITGVRSGVASHSGNAFLASATVVNFSTSASAIVWNATNPATWVSGDLFGGTVEYEAA